MQGISRPRITEETNKVVESDVFGDREWNMNCLKKLGRRKATPVSRQGEKTCCEKKGWDDRYEYMTTLRGYRP